jgi:hypothetical protein
MAWDMAKAVSSPPARVSSKPWFILLSWALRSIEKDETTKFLFLSILKDQEEHHDTFSTMLEQV